MEIRCDFNMLYRFLIKGCPIPNTSNLVGLCQFRRMIPGVSSSSQNWYNSLFVSKDSSSPKKDQTSKTSENPAFSHRIQHFPRAFYGICTVRSSHPSSQSHRHTSLASSPPSVSIPDATPPERPGATFRPLGIPRPGSGTPCVVKTHSETINSTWIRIKLQERNGNNFITQYILDTEFRGGTYPLQVDKLRR